jgi:arginyl-tRNA synthetase
LPDLELSPQGLARAETGKLTDEGELRLAKRLAQWPRLVEAAALAHEPHRVAFFLHDLASEFHAHWNRGNDLPHLRFIIRDDPTLTMARALLVSGLATVLASGLAILGVGALEEM